MKRSLFARSAGAGLILVLHVAARGNEITYQCSGLGAVLVPDNAAGDSDPALNHLRVEFDQTVVAGGFSWRATGTLIGIADPPFGAQATTRLENLTIQNLAGNVGGQMFSFTHTFPQLGPPLPVNTFSLTGHFDSLVTPGLLEGGRLAYTASVTWLGGIESLGGGDTGHVSGAAPIPFAFAGGPVSPIHPTAHSALLTFYLDSPGDAILMGGGEGWDIEAAPVPGPASVMVFACAGLGVRRRRQV